MSEDLIIRQCAPTLAGLKTGSLFSCPYASPEELKANLRSYNRRLQPKGIRMVPLRRQGGRVLVYVYRPERLKADLNRRGAGSLLRRYGYPRGGAEAQVCALIRRLKTSPEFPHEIGLFLGYPVEDVRGFIEHQAKNSKCTGCWKVYGDEAQARRTFDRYKKCTALYCARWAEGVPLERLTVACSAS